MLPPVNCVCQPGGIAVPGDLFSGAPSPELLLQITEMLGDLVSHLQLLSEHLGLLVARYIPSFRIMLVARGACPCSGDMVGESGIKRR